MSRTILPGRCVWCDERFTVRETLRDMFWTEFPKNPEYSFDRFRSVFCGDVAKLKGLCHHCKSYYSMRLYNDVTDDYMRRKKYENV